MKERPILFSGPMVRALLAGTKTQTRRVVKTQPESLHHGEPYWHIGGYRAGAFRGITDPLRMGTHNPLTCPYGQPGDRLWVREAWARTSVFPGTEMVVYREGDNRTDYGGPWKPGIHMFRRDSRITLEVTGVRVERLQDISEADALAEGIVQLRDGGFGLPAGEHYHATDPRISYWSLWEHINGAGSVEANPWVWVIEWPALLNV
jgi:hypothetical protein